MENVFNSSDCKRDDTLAVFQQRSTEELVKHLVLLPFRVVGGKLNDFDANEETEKWPFRELIS